MSGLTGIGHGICEEGEELLAGDHDAPPELLLLELGKDPKVVQERLGHSTITTTMNIYSHVTPTMQRSAVDRFAAHLGKA